MKSGLEFLDLEDLLALVRALGAGPVRDIGLLDAACARPQATAFGIDAYPSLQAKAAALLHSLVRNHGLVDGNTLLGWLGTAVFLDLNGCPVSAEEDEVFDLVMRVDEGTIGVEDITTTLTRWSATPD